MPSLKEVKRRIVSIESTRKITQARQMIAGTQLHKRQGLLTHALTYEEHLRQILSGALNTEKPITSPFTEKRTRGAIALVVMSSNSGMCGAFNTKIMKEVDHIQAHLAGEELLFIPIGKKAREALKANHCRMAPCSAFDHLVDKAEYPQATEAAEQLMQLFVSGTVKQIQIVFCHFKSTAVQEVRQEQFLPYLPCPLPPAPEYTPYLFEPAREKLLEEILPHALTSGFYTRLIDQQTAEAAARAMAMQLATENANDMLEQLNLMYNKARQQNITAELLDIVGSSFV
jgi:F-type H+-transporting ATPase subunit gamma